MNTNRIAIIGGIFAALGGIAAFLTYVENEKSRKLHEDVLLLDKQIKQLDLSQKRNQITV